MSAGPGRASALDAVPRAPACIAVAPGFDLLDAHVAPLFLAAFVAGVRAPSGPSPVPQAP